MSNNKDTFEDLRVVTLREFANLNSISFATAKRLLGDGNGPPVIQLSAKRIGIRLADARKWQQQRIRR